MKSAEILKNRCNTKAKVNYCSTHHIPQHNVTMRHYTAIYNHTPQRRTTLQTPLYAVIRYYTPLYSTTHYYTPLHSTTYYNILCSTSAISPDKPSVSKWGKQADVYVCVIHSGGCAILCHVCHKWVTHESHSYHTWIRHGHHTHVLYTSTISSEEA